MPNRDHQTLFRLKLTSLLRRTRLRVAGHGVARVLAVGGPMVLLAAWTAGAPFGPGGFLAGGLVLSVLAGLAALLWSQLLAPLLKLRRAQDLVRRIEKDGDFANVLVAGEEGFRWPERWAGDDPVRRELRSRLYRHGVKILDFLTPDQVARYSYRRLPVAGVVLFLGAALVLLVTAPETMRRGAGRLLNPWPAEQPVPTRGLYAAAGPDFVVAGEDLDLTVVDFSSGHGLAVCEIRTGQGLWQPLEAVAQPVARDPAWLPAPFRQWTAVVSNAREDFSWRFRRGTLVSNEGSVTVRHHPLLTGLTGKVQPPAYTGVPDQQLTRLPSWFEVPAGSRLHLEGEVNHALRRASLITSRGDSLGLDLEGTRIAGTLAVDTTQSFFLVLEDSFGLRNQAALEFEISALPDAAPLVNLTRPDDDGVFPLDGSLRLLTDAADDYGLTALRLETRVLPGASSGQETGDAPWAGGVCWDPGYPPQAGWSTPAGPVQLVSHSPEEGRSSLRVGLEMQVDLTGLEMVTGDVLELRLVAVDNRRPGSGQTGRSRVLRLVLPSAADMLTAQAEASEERRGELTEMRRRSRELGVDLERLNRELMKNPLPDWARQQEMETAIQRQKSMQEELARLSEALQQDLDRLAAGQMTSQALLDKAEEVSQLLSQPPGESLSELLAKMEKAGEQVDPAQVAEAIREVAKNQKDMARRLDAALAMLKRMEREQDMEGLASLLEQLIRKQQELADLSREMADKKQAEEPSEGSQSDSQPPEGDQQEGDTSKGDQQQGDQQQGEQKQGEQQQGEQQQGDQQQGEQPSPSPEELARRQQALAEELEQLKDKLEEALAALQEEQQAGDESPSGEKMEQALQQALDKLEEQMEKGDMSKASEQLAEMDPDQAAQMQQEALKDLGSLYHVLMESQQAMQMAMEQNQVSSLRQLAADMLAVSTRQEEIAGRIPSQLRDVRSQHLTRSQHRLQKATTGVRDRLSLLLDESPTRIMKLLSKLDDLIEQMGHVVEAMEDNRGPVARRDAKASLAEANRLVIGLLTEAQINSKSSSGGSGDPQQSMAEKLQQMAIEQAKLNGMTEQLRQMLANRGLSQEARAQMQRLGEAQGNLGGKLNELEEEERTNPEGERLLGDLGALGQQMERISGELDDGLVSEETLVRQERILSRLLDARNSVRRRDYTTRRESRTAARLYDDMEGRATAGESQDPEGPFRLRYQALEKAPLEYRELVRRYFTALDSLRRLDAAPWEGADPAPEGRDMP